VAGGENCNKVLVAVRARGGLTQSELGRKAGIMKDGVVRRSCVRAALQSLIAGGFAEERGESPNLKYYPTQQKGFMFR